MSFFNSFRNPKNYKAKVTGSELANRKAKVNTVDLLVKNNKKKIR